MNSPHSKPKQQRRRSTQAFWKLFVPRNAPPPHSQPCHRPLVPAVSARARAAAAVWHCNTPCQVPARRLHGESRSRPVPSAPAEPGLCEPREPLAQAWLQDGFGPETHPQGWSSTHGPVCGTHYIRPPGLCGLPICLLPPSATGCWLAPALPYVRWQLLSFFFLLLPLCCYRMPRRVPWTPSACDILALWPCPRCLSPQNVVISRRHPSEEGFWKWRLGTRARQVRHVLRPSPSPLSTGSCLEILPFANAAKCCTCGDRASPLFGPLAGEAC